jgi:glucose 1-dehydrogenase
MEISLAGKVAMVTGADQGIGRGIAEALAGSGADIFIAYHRNVDGANEVAAGIRKSGRRVEIAQVDVGMPDQVERLFGEFDKAFDKIDILVNNAGMGIHGYVKDQPFEEWERVIRTDLHGPFLCSQQAIRRMLAQEIQGRIINITSVHEEACWAGDAAYCVAKGGLRNLTRSMALELGEHGITVNNIGPGMILTPMNKRAMADSAYLKQAEALFPMRRVGVPADIGQMACFLASDAASYCTGSTFFVDGGWMLSYPPV